jgi:hypothetical protein
MVYFSDFFQVSEELIENYGAFNISLINDLPLFIDPFLLFGSEKDEYQKLHEEIIDYLVFLKNKAAEGSITKAQVSAWYQFSEVKQNWLGYSLYGNGGSGLGMDFGSNLSSNIHLIYSDLRKETVTTSSHLEKAGLFSIGIGKDNISDFSCNLIKKYLLEYTENFAIIHLEGSQTKKINVGKVYFDYERERWMPKEYVLPYFNGDFVILTPKDLLTKDDNWINSHDLIGDFESICESIPNNQMRAEIHNYFNKRLPIKENKKKPSQKEFSRAVIDTLNQFPLIIDYYIKQKEENKKDAEKSSQTKVNDVESVFIRNVQQLVLQLQNQTEFYSIQEGNSFEAALKRIEFLKHVIENNDGYRLFYHKGQPIKREADLQIIYRLTWFATFFDVNRETNNGRGPVDYAISKGSKDKTLVEFKLASNSQLKRNLENQVAIYEKANDTNKSIKVIMFFTQEEFLKVSQILKDLKLESEANIVLIDAGKDNKTSASKV